MRFYSEVIGLEFCPCHGYHMDPPHFDVGGAYLSILKGTSFLSQDAQFFPIVALAVDDLDSAVERLKAFHVELLKHVEEDSSSRWVFFRDPGGNLVESVWTAWKDWDFGQKKSPSRWLTFLAWRIIRRVEL